MLNKKYCIIAVILFILLFANYLTNCFHTVQPYWFENWQTDSEALIKGRIFVIEHYGFLKDFGLLQMSAGYEKGFADYETLTPYLSQLGFGGTLFGAIKILTHGIGFCYGLNVFILCGLLFAILKWIYDEFGILPSIAGYVAMFFSGWMTVSARNLYWIPFTLILPFVISLFFLKREEKTGKISVWLWAFLIFASVFFKSGCGFEFISCVLINSVLPIFYYGCKNNWSVSKIIKRFFIIGCTGLLGFLSAIGLHIYQLSGYFGNLSQALSLMQNDVARRTAATVLTMPTQGFVINSMSVPKFQVISTYLAGESVIFGLKMNILICICALTFLYKSENQNLHALKIFTLVSLLSPLSWYILASPHSYIHTHINYLLWSYPCIILIFACIGYVIENYYKKRS